MPFLPAPIRSWLCARLAVRLARTMAGALQETADACRIEVGLARGAAAPTLPAAWPAHRRLALLTTTDAVRRRHALWIRLTGAERMVLALDGPTVPRLRLWIGHGPAGRTPGVSAFAILPLRPRP